MAGQGWPVRVRGVVTYADTQWGRLFVQEEGGALAVDISGTSQPYAARRSHRRRRMDRSLGRAGPPPGHPATVERLGNAPPPAPASMPLASITAATCDGRSLQTTGVVKELSIWNGYLRLHVTSGQHSIELRVQEYPLLDMSARDRRVDPVEGRVRSGPCRQTSRWRISG